jgi:hypothetical protein
MCDSGSTLAGSLFVCLQLLGRFFHVGPRSTQLNLRELAFHGLFLSFLLFLRPRTRVVGLRNLRLRCVQHGRSQQRKRVHVNECGVYAR